MPARRQLPPTLARHACSGDAGLATSRRRPPGPDPESGQVLTQGARLRHLRQRPPPPPPRRGAARRLREELAADRPADRRSAPVAVRAERRHRHGTRVLLRGHRARARRARTWPSATSSSPCRSRSTPTGLHGIGFSNVYTGGYAELMVLNELHGASRSRPASSRRDGRADRAARRRRARRGQERHPQRRERRSCSGCGRSAWPCIADAEAARDRPDRRRRLLADAPGAGRAARRGRGRRSRGERGRSRRGGKSTACGRS